MTYAPHLRLTMGADLPAGEQAVCTVSLVPDNVAFGTIADWLGDTLVGDYLANIWNACTAFWARPQSHIAPTSVLKRLKLVEIDANGHYASLPKEAVRNVPGGETLGNTYPNQIARKVTLETDGDLERVKGGFYLPGVTDTGYDLLTGLFSAAVATDVANSVKDFINDIENGPGVDFTGVKVVVASQGRHGAGGAVRVPPANHDVKRVNVGRRLDVQRRRANKISETRTADAVPAS